MTEVPWPLMGGLRLKWLTKRLKNILFQDGGAIYFSNLKIETAECVAPKPTPTPRPSYRYPYWGWPGCIICK